MKKSNLVLANFTRVRGAALPGMSLIEIMVVILLIGLVAGGGAVLIFGQLSRGQVRSARTQSYELAKSLDLYKLQNGSYPSASEGLSALTSGGKGGEPLLDRLPLDPWKNEYMYRNPGVKNPGGIDVFSRGPDGIESEDDVGNWPEE